MTSLLRSTIAALCISMLLAGAAYAVPSLQLDIVGGTYDWSTETITANAESFTLFAYLDATRFNPLSDTYTLSAALAPQTPYTPGGMALGSFSINGSTVNVTNDMQYGIPPIESYLARDPGDLPSHGIYNTYFTETSFNFTSSQQTRRGEEQQRLDHGTMFYDAVKQGLVDDRRSVQIGLRTTTDEPLGFHILDARRVQRDGPEAVAAEARRIVGRHKVYLTFDIDCLDPGCAPGTGTPVCGGLTTFQALEIIRGLAGIDLVGMDVVEVAPAYDVGEITALAGATLAAEMLCLHAVGRERTTP